MELELFPSCSRVPVKDGHLQSVSVEFTVPVSGEDVAQALAAFRAEPQQLALPTAPLRPIIVHDGANRPQPALDVNAGEPGRAMGMAVTVRPFACNEYPLPFFPAGAQYGTRRCRRFGAERRTGLCQKTAPGRVK